MPAKSKPVLRAHITRLVRQFFFENGFIETDTPSFVLSPGMEPHIRPFRVEGTRAFLHTSPEFAMKKILATGEASKIFQVCKVFRSEPFSQTHHPEFTMLEWYRTNAGYEQIMNDVEALFAFVARGIQSALPVQQPWLRLSIAECFLKFAEIDLVAVQSEQKFFEACVARKILGASDLDTSDLQKPGTWDDLFFRVMLNCVEPALQKLGQPVIVYDYPESQAALANLKTDASGLRWAKRFEVYAGGFELANAFDELTDPQVQRQRFEKDMKLRHQIYGDSFPANPIDESFIECLSKLPPSAGIALGIDRLVMYFTGASDIQETLWLPSYQ